MIFLTKKIIIPGTSITVNYFVPSAVVSFTILGKSLGFSFHICKQTHFLEVKDFFVIFLQNVLVDIGRA